MEKTKFTDWIIDGYTAKSIDGKYEFWIANGFFFFRDIYPHFPREAVLTHVNIFTRYKVWRELKEEIKIRTSKFYQ